MKGNKEMRLRMKGEMRNYVSCINYHNNSINNTCCSNDI